MDSGRGDNHRSGSHLSALSPQVALFKLLALVATMMYDPFGTKISFISSPFTPVIGVDNGKTISRCAL